MAIFALETHKPQVVSADGTRIWAAQAGRAVTEAPTIVFVPGFASSALLYEHQFRDEELLSKFCLPRGQGRSDVPLDDEACTSERFAQDFEAVCKHYKAGKVFLAGWSAGCATSTDVFANHLEHYIAGLIYLAGLPYLDAFATACFPAMVPNYFPLMGPTDGDTMGPAIANFLRVIMWEPNRAKMTYSFRSALVGTVVQVPTTGRTRASQSHKQDPEALLKKAGEFETLLVLADKEEVVENDKAEALFREHFPRLTVITVPDAGHTVFWEQPEATNRTIADFVEGVTTKR